MPATHNVWYEDVVVSMCDRHTAERRVEATETEQRGFGCSWAFDPIGEDR